MRLFPLTAAFLGLTFGTLAFRARERRGYGPFLLGMFAAASVLLGKFSWDSKPTIYCAVGLLVVASEHVAMSFSTERRSGLL